jgi:microcystin degradation protein MlrC
MRSLFAERARLEAAEELAAVSLCPVHPYLDVPEHGFSAVAVADGRPDRAAATAETLARAAWDRRADFRERLPGLAAVLDRLVAGGATPAVVADRGDVTLAGAPGDSPVVLRALLDRADAAGLSAALPVVDRPAVDALVDAGEGAERVALGGTLTPAFEPVDADVVVEATFDGPVVLDGSYSSGSEVDMGRRVVARVADRELRAIVSERPGITTDPSFFSEHGIDPAGQDLLVVKSIGTFRPGFEPIAGSIDVVDTPGLSSVDLSSFSYERSRPVHPLDDPTPAFEAVGDGAGDA